MDLDENEDEQGLEGQLEDDMQCLDRDEPDFDCWVEDDENSDGTATIGCSGCSPDGTQSGFEAAMATFFQNLVGEHGRPVQLRRGCVPDVARGRHLPNDEVQRPRQRISPGRHEIVRFPFGDSGLFDLMNLWGPEGCRWPVLRLPAGRTALRRVLVDLRGAEGRARGHLGWAL